MGLPETASDARARSAMLLAGWRGSSPVPAALSCRHRRRTAAGEGFRSPDNSLMRRFRRKTTMPLPRGSPAISISRADALQISGRSRRHRAPTPRSRHEAACRLGAQRRRFDYFRGSRLALSFTGWRWYWYRWLPRKCFAGKGRVYYTGRPLSAGRPFRPATLSPAGRCWPLRLDISMMRFDKRCRRAGDAVGR